MLISHIDIEKFFLQWRISFLNQVGCKMLHWAVIFSSDSEPFSLAKDPVWGILELLGSQLRLCLGSDLRVEIVFVQGEHESHKSHRYSGREQIKWAFYYFYRFLIII